MARHGTHKQFRELKECFWGIEIEGTESSSLKEPPPRREVKSEAPTEMSCQALLQIAAQGEMHNTH